eukprot:GHVN01012011.1.p1 GENE.GHVN01012011.1~~GHVN01012011.1.p1  ORF type:complete len:339 (-),score=43.28 GHVN01012011.1:568-1584(-)
MDFLNELRGCIRRNGEPQYFTEARKKTESIEDASYVGIGDSGFDIRESSGYRVKGDEKKHYSLCGVCFAFETRKMQMMEYMKECRRRRVEMVSSVDRENMIKLLLSERDEEVDSILLEPISGLSRPTQDREIEAAMEREEFFVDFESFMGADHNFCEIAAKARAHIKSDLGMLDEKKKASKAQKGGSLLESISSTNRVLQQKKAGAQLIVFIPGHEDEISFDSVIKFLRDGVLDLSWVEERTQPLLLKRKEEPFVEYELIDRPHALSPEDWSRVSCVIRQKEADGWGSKSDGVCVFFGFDDRSHGCIQNKILFSRTKRYTDAAAFVTFWRLVDRSAFW